MKQIEISTVIKCAKNLRLLYVEDDVELRNQTKKLFDTIFKFVKVASDGKEALEFYKEDVFDIVISDIKMPIMDGVDLTKEIKKINFNQPVIITSAYNDSEYLLEFINLNVNQFVMKPIKLDNLLNSIYDVSKNVVNSNIIESYRKDLEKSNIILKEKNDELQSLVRILDSKITQISGEQINTIKDLDTNNIEVSKEHLEELKELEIDISGVSVLISLSKNISMSNINVLCEMFDSYANIISQYNECEELTLKIKILAKILNSITNSFIKRIEDISVLLESFIYVLRMWRKNLEQGETKKAFELHASMINDISTIIDIINKGEKL